MHTSSDVIYAHTLGCHTQPTRRLSLIAPAMATDGNKKSVRGALFSAAEDLALAGTVTVGKILLGRLNVGYDGRGSEVDRWTCRDRNFPGSYASEHILNMSN